MIDVDVTHSVGAFSLKVAFSNDDGVTALFGQSGAGKSLTLSIIAGLTRPDAGFVRLDDETLTDAQRRIFVPVARRRIGLVFQDSNLFPHLSVKQNLLYGRWFAPRAAQRIDFDAVVETLGIGPLLARPPARLSGGERQRVAIGRALLSCPRLLLFDEPLAALDMPRKLEIMPLIEKLRDEFRVPIVYVSHAADEVMRLASRVVMLEAGRVKFVGDPATAFNRLANTTLENRFDLSSVLTARVAGAPDAYGLTTLDHPAGTISVAGFGGAPGDLVQLVVKATDVVLSRTRPSDISLRSILAGKVSKIRKDTFLAIVEVELAPGSYLLAAITEGALAHLSLEPGSTVFAMFKSAALDERAVANVGHR
jgi:molybdate transport system ATP-binding protein